MGEVRPRKVSLVFAWDALGSRSSFTERSNKRVRSRSYPDKSFARGERIPPVSQTMFDTQNLFKRLLAASIILALSAPAGALAQDDEPDLNPIQGSGDDIQLELAQNSEDFDLEEELPTDSGDEDTTSEDDEADEDAAPPKKEAKKAKKEKQDKKGKKAKKAKKAKKSADEEEEE